MFIMRGHTAKLEDLPMLQAVRTPGGEVGAVMRNSGIWTYVLRPDGSSESVLRDTVVEVLVSQWDLAIAGLRQLEKELKDAQANL